MRLLRFLMRSHLAVVMCTPLVAVAPFSHARQQKAGYAPIINYGQRESLRTRAQKADIEVTAIDESYELGNLSSLKKEATAVIIGRVAGQKALFDGDDSILTIYTIEIKRVLKDDSANWPYAAQYGPPAPLSSPLEVSRNGGEVEVNGHRAIENIEASKWPAKLSGDYVIFLSWNPVFKAYRPTGVASGFFAVDESARVHPLGARPELKKYQDMPLSDFLKELEK